MYRFKYLIAIPLFSILAFTNIWKNATKKEAIHWLNSLSKNTERQKNYSVNIIQTEFISDDAEIPQRTVPGSYHFKDGMMKSSFRGITTIQNKTVRITIDSARKVILVSDCMSLQNNTGISEGVIGNGKTIEQELDNDNKIKGIRLNYNAYTTWKSIYIRVNEYHLLSRYEVILNHGKASETGQPAKTRTDYSDYKFNQNTDHDFDISSYINISPGQVTPAGSFMEFTVKDLRIHKK